MEEEEKEEEYYGRVPSAGPFLPRFGPIGWLVCFRLLFSLSMVPPDLDLDSNLTFILSRRLIWTPDVERNRMYFIQKQLGHSKQRLGPEISGSNRPCCRL